MNKVISILFPVLAAFLTTILTISTCTICHFVAYQPVMEEGIEDFKKCR